MPGMEERLKMEEEARKAAVIKAAKEEEVRRNALYIKMLKRANLDDHHVMVLDRMNHKQGSDSVHLGAKSQGLYRTIYHERVFNDLYELVHGPKARLKKMPSVARKLLSYNDNNLSSGGAGGGGVGGKGSATAGHKGKHALNSEKYDIGYKAPIFGPPGTTTPFEDILNSEGREVYFSYKGDWADGEMHGYGRYKFVDGTDYVGAMRHDWPDGHGTAVYPDGSIYEGSFKNGKRHGEGTMKYSTGSEYAGMWSEGLRHGHGQLKYPNSSHYDGDFLRGQFHGGGTFHATDLNVSYKGNFELGFLRGYGTLTMADGSTVIRDWPKFNKFGGGLSVRGAVELVKDEEQQDYLMKLESREELYGVAVMLQLNEFVADIRKQLHEQREEEKQQHRLARRQLIKETKERLKEMRIQGLLEMSTNEQKDGLEAEFDLD